MAEDGKANEPEPLEPDSAILVDVARMRMPFGRHAGRRLIDLPEPYVVWFRRQGWPRGRLGMLLATLYEIKANGLEELLAPLREPGDPRRRDAPSPDDRRERPVRFSERPPRSGRR